MHTEQGEVHTDIVVNAAGYRCNEVAAMMNVELPVAPRMEHQYILTEPLAQVKAVGHPLPTIRCPHDAQTIPGRKKTDCWSVFTSKIAAPGE